MRLTPVTIERAISIPVHHGNLSGFVAVAASWHAVWTKARMTMSLRISGFIILTLISPAVVRGAGSVRTVAFSGDPVPGDPNLVFDAFGIPLLTVDGQTLFTARLKGPGQPAIDSLFSEIGGPLGAIGRQSDPAPSTPDGVLFRTFYPTGFARDGSVAFQGILTGPGVNDGNNAGNWIAEPNRELRFVARSGDVAPGLTGDTTFGFVYGPMMGTDGPVVFRADLIGTSVDESNDNSIWRAYPDGEVALLMRDGDSIPNMSEDVRFLYLNGEPAINGQGQVAFASGMRGPGIGGENDTGIWIADARNNLSLVARKGDPAPDTGEGTVVNYLGNYVLNDAGYLAISGELAGADISPDARGVLWVGPSDSLHVLVKGGDHAPGTPDSVFFTGFPNVALNRHGDAAFQGYLRVDGGSPSNYVGIWTNERDGEVSLVARAWEPAPGTEDGVLFNFELMSPPVINDLGQVAFSATLRGPSIGSSNDRGIWATDAEGTLQLVAREGDQVDVDDGASIDLRTIRQVNIYTPPRMPNGISRGLNDQGQIAYRAIFTDGSSGIFVSNAVAIPEPSTWAMGLWALSMFGRRSRRRESEVCR